MEKNVMIGTESAAREIFGVADMNRKLLEKKFGVKIGLGADGIRVKGPEKRTEQAARLIEKLARLRNEGMALDPDELRDYLRDRLQEAGRKSVVSGAGRDGGTHEQGIAVPSLRKRQVLPQTDGQKDYLRAMEKHDVVFSLGPAGTGKTYLAVAKAVNYLAGKKVRRIILARPAIEAGESLGFLPGDVPAKLGPYVRPLYDALYDMMDAPMIENYLETGTIEIAPLAYMRGRTLNNAFVILDEAQNCTSEQLKMFLTRLGFDSKTVITGDMTQSDLPGGKPTGLIEAIKILKPISGIRFVHLTKKDVVRHPLIQKIIQAYEDFYRETDL
ncbi:MAG: AAA family ATPase [Candidatus Omnitrophica bacterium]|nr:AAA family ATPase [Candidatus Omnitrophota bacterium]